MDIVATGPKEILMKRYGIYGFPEKPTVNKIALANKEFREKKVLQYIEECSEEVMRLKIKAIYCSQKTITYFICPTCNEKNMRINVRQMFFSTDCYKKRVVKKMPIKKENRKRYPKNWKEIRTEVLKRACHHCEGSPQYPDCKVKNHSLHPVTGSMVILTIAHLDHIPENCGEPGNRPNLKAWCQRCHNTYDMPHRIKNAKMTREKKRNQK